MVRKTTRSAALKANEKVRRESPRRTRRRKSSSRSEDSEEETLSNIKKTQPTNRSEKGSSGNESDTDSKKPLKKRTRSMAINNAKDTNLENQSQSTEIDKNIQKEDQEEVNEENISKGKSKSINKSKIDTLIPETENENVQVTESPNAKDDNPPNDDELSKNGTETTEIDVNISQSLVAEMTCDNQSSEIVTEQTTEIVITEHAKSAESNANENSSDLTQCNLEEVERTVEEHGEKTQHKEENSTLEPLKDSEVREDPTIDSSSEGSRKIKLNRLKRDKNKPDKEENENENRKKITLKRPESKQTSVDDVKREENRDSSPKQPSEGDGWGSSYELQNSENQDEKTAKSEEKPARKRITLKRSTLDETSGGEKKESTSLGRSISHPEKRERRKSSTTDKESTSLGRSISHPEKRERRKSSTTDNIIINEGRRRRSSEVGKSISESEEKPQKPKKPTKVVKIIRKLPEDTHEPPPPGEEPVKKYKWDKLEMREIPDIFNLENLKEICPKIEFLDEEDVDLEIKMREPKSPEKSKRKTFQELEEEEMENIEAELNAEPEEMEIKENIIAMNRKISIVDDTASKLKPPPSPSKNPVSEVLFITNLVRPFTAKQLKELLERTGKIREDGFWTDRIKSKCYVCYDTTEEAESTRNALHGVHWPIGNGKKLIIDFATVEDMENAKNPPIIVVPKKEKSPEKENKKPDLHEDRQDRKDVRTTKREWDIGKEDDHRRKRSHSRSRERRERKHSRRSYTPDVHHKKRRHEEPVPQKAMDDLFQKTKATPSIYWQPLSPEEIARKQQQRQLRLEENKRRLEEIRSTGRGGIRDRQVRDRNFRRR